MRMFFAHNRLQELFGIGGLLANLIALPHESSGADLLNVNFTAHQNSAFTTKMGMAAVGISTNDFWNVYSRDDGQGGFRSDGQLLNMKWADGSISQVGLNVTNAAGAWATFSPDAMFNSYLYPLGGTNITLWITNLAAGTYDFYVYAHGLPDEENGVVELKSGAINYGQESTSTAPGWNTIHWEEGQQFVLFTDVVVTGDQPVVITVLPGKAGKAVLNGVQIIKRSEAPPSATVADWTFEEGVPGQLVTRAEDHSGNGHTGSIIMGSPRFVLSEAGDQGSVSIYLPPGNTAGSGFGPADSPDFNLAEQFTLETAIKAGENNAGPYKRYLVGGFNPASGRGVFGLGYDGGLGVALIGALNGPVPLDGRSHHVAAVYHKPLLSLYIDGLPVGSTNFVIEGFPATGAPFRLTVGADYNGGFWFNGAIDRVRISNQALSPRDFFTPAAEQPLTKLPSTNDLWDVSQGVTVVNHSSIRGGFDIRNMFGGSFVTIEPSTTIFGDNQPPGFIHFVEWQTPAPVRVRSFNLFAAGDIAIPELAIEREFAHFTLRAKSPGSANYDLTLFDFTPTHPYQFLVTNSVLLVSTNILSVTAQEFRAEFTQFTFGRGFDGPRIVELDGFGEPILPPIDDGIAADWRERYFGPNYLNDSRATAEADPDGDRANNFQEFRDGTDPLDAHSVKRLPLSVSTYAGSVGGSKDGYRTEATFLAPCTVDADPKGRLWVAEATLSGVGAHRIRIIDTNGIVSTLAGGTEPGEIDGPVTTARFNGPLGVVFDTLGNAFLSDLLGHRIRKIAPNGVVSTLAGSTAGFRDGYRTNAMFDHPYEMAIDSNNNLYVPDFYNLRVRKITPQGEVSTYAGSGRGDQDGNRLTATFNSPNFVAMARNGTLYVADYSNGKVRQITADGLVSTLAANLPLIESVAVDPEGNVYASIPGAGRPSLRKFNPDGALIWSISTESGFQDGPISEAKFGRLNAPEFLADGNFLVPDAANNRIRLVTVGVQPLLTIRPEGGRFTNSVQVTISSTVTNATVRYTLDKTVPTTNSPLYTNGIRLIQTTTIKARAFVNDYPISGLVGAAFLTTGPSPVTIVTQPQSQTVAVGARVILQVVATGSPPLLYHWWFNGTPLPGAMSDKYSIPSIQSSQFGTYTVVISNLLGSVTSAPALLQRAPEAGFVQRRLPAGYMPGVKLGVTLEANPPAGTAVYAIQDQPPAGWTVGAISNDGVFDPVNKQVKFGPFFDAAHRTLTYEVTPPQAAQGAQRFTGIASADGSETTVSGDTELELARYHPADKNPADWRITIGEMTAYSAAWKRGQTWSMPPNPIPISYMTRAALLWKGGELYQFNPAVTSAPLWWVNPPRPLSLGPAVPAPRIARASLAALGNSAEARMPNHYLPGQPLTVTVAVTPADGVTVYAAEDQPPSAWGVSGISHDGAYDQTNRKVKWGPFFDSQPRSLSYQATPPPDCTGVVAFSGVSSFDGLDAVIGGQRQSSPATTPPLQMQITAGKSSAADLSLTVLGELGLVFQIEVSDDLVSWRPLVTLTNLNGQVTFIDPGVTNRAQGFYRALPQ